MPIRVLPTYLVNKIAAGEVIERPASIVKELVENALDAGARRIDVVVEDGGRKLIAVTDDGCGMDGADLELAFVPHATSKIGGEDDLFAVTTMGFRGEALASVASVAHAHIRTCRRPAGGKTGPEAASGHEIDADGGDISAVRPCAAAGGATVTIRDLFFNTPARRKFLKSAATELGHVTDQIIRLALPHPQTAFTLAHNGRGVYNLPSVASTQARAGDLFGPELAGSLLTVEGRQGPPGVSGLICPPAAARGSGKWQYFFVNGRYVRDRLFSHALREAYRGLLDASRWPVAMLFLEIDPSEVDVNVHPTKIEVRFRDGQLVHGQLLAAVRETLNRANLTPDASLASAAARGLDEGAGPPASADEERRRESLRAAMADFFKSIPPVQPRLSFPEPTPRTSTGREGPMPATTLGLAGPIGPCTPTPGAAPAQAATEIDQPPQPTAPAPPQTTLQLHNTYIVTACEDGILIIDQHALHERLIYNDLKRRLAGGSLDGQRLLIPIAMRVTEGEADSLARRRDLLDSIGLEIVPFGPGTVAIQQYPLLLAQRHVSADDFVRELIDRLADDETAEAERLLEDVLAMMACKAAVKAGDPLTAAEMDNLIARRLVAEKAAACPHGRPASIRLTLKDLQKQFKRT